MIGWGEFIKGGVPAVWGLLGLGVGSWLTSRHQRIERRNARMKEQLMEFYAPLRGMRAQIKAKSELRTKVHVAGEDLWAKQFEGIDDPEMKKEIDSANWEKYEKTLDYSNKQMEAEIIPLYRKMLEHFSTHMGLAEESTLEHYGTFVEFVEIWNRWMEKSLPPEVANRLNHSEKKVYPLYDDIEMNFRILSMALRK